MATAYLARFTPRTITSSRTATGAAKLHSRGTLENAYGPRVRTVMAYGRLHDLVLPALEEGRTVLLKGHYEHFAGHDGRRVEIFKPFAVLKIFERPATPRPANDTAANDDARAPVTGHERRGHYRRRKGGVPLPEAEWIWVRSTSVRGGRRAA